MLLLILLFLQSLRDFDCADSFLLEATAEGAPLRAGRAAPRWSFTAIEGPLHDPSSRQKSVWKQLESGSLLILKPVDEVSFAFLNTVAAAFVVDIVLAVPFVADDLHEPSFDAVALVGVGLSTFALFRPVVL